MNALKIALAVFMAHWFWFVSQPVFGQTDMSEDFVTKGLPASANLPTGNLDRAAETMAQQITKSDGQSLPVLLAALQTAGFSIIDEKGTVLRKPSGGGPGQGLAFYDFEAVGSLKLETSGASISLAKLAGAITKEVPQIQASQFAELLVTDLRTQASSSNSTYLRFWARLIIELGKYSAQPVDMMTAPASRINLSVLQASLLVRRLQGDVYTLKRKLPQSGMILPPFSQRTVGLPAFWKTDDLPLLQLVKDSSNSSLPCNLTGDDGLILDATANGLTYGFGKWMELLEVSPIAGLSGKALGVVSKGLGIAGAVLSWAELVAALTLVKGEMVVDNPPLIRTLNSVPGEKRLMTAKIWFDVGKKQIVNCFRTAINMTFGLDFSLPSEGPATDMAVEWEFANVQAEAKFVWLEAPHGKDRNPFKQVTDNNGVSQMWLVGAPKMPPIVKNNPKKITKTAHVRVSARLKSSKDFLQNWIDIGGVMLGGWSGGTATAIAEIGFRLPYVVARATIPVIDHEAFAGYKPIVKGVDIPEVICSLEKPFTFTASLPGWIGTVTFVPTSATAGTFSNSNTFSGNYGTMTTGNSKASYRIEGVDTPMPRLVMMWPGGPITPTITLRDGKQLYPPMVTHESTSYADLVPLETDECNER
ncbi:MAG: hypothetical protein CV088_13655 [Nitrospira sp. LK70]|nr:hypothetical protein [Nitrospira sp. LK70]